MIAATFNVIGAFVHRTIVRSRPFCIIRARFSSVHMKIRSHVNAWARRCWCSYSHDQLLTSTPHARNPLRLHLAGQHTRSSAAPRSCCQVHLKLGQRSGVQRKCRVDKGKGKIIYCTSSALLVHHSSPSHSHPSLSSKIPTIPPSKTDKSQPCQKTGNK